MSACEKCWGDAHFAAASLGGSQVDHYHRLRMERMGTLCPPVPHGHPHVWDEPDDNGERGHSLDCWCKSAPARTPFDKEYL